MALHTASQASPPFPPNSSPRHRIKTQLKSLSIAKEISSLSLVSKLQSTGTSQPTSPAALLLESLEAHTPRWQISSPRSKGQPVKQAQEKSATLSHLERCLQPEERTGTLLHLEKCLDASDLSSTTPDLGALQFHGTELRVAFQQGSPRAYSEIAVSNAYPKSKTVPCQQLEGAFFAVESRKADRALLPLENTLDGTIHRTYDLLLRHNLHIVGEIHWPVHHCFLTLPGVKQEELRRVIGHPQALSQCQKSILGMGPNVSVEPVDDIAGSAHFLAVNNLRDVAILASERVAQTFDLDVLASGIQDDFENVTRFLVLAKEAVMPKVDGQYKTTVALVLADGLGALYKVLAAFTFRDIKVTKVESRPWRNRPVRVVERGEKGVASYFEYVIFVDFEGSVANLETQNALRQLEEHSSFVRVLGSYPMDTTPFTKPRNTRGGGSGSFAKHDLAAAATFALLPST